MEKDFEKEVDTLLDSVEQFAKRFPDAGVCFMAVEERNDAFCHVHRLDAKPFLLTVMISNLVSRSPQIKKSVMEGTTITFSE